MSDTSFHDDCLFQERMRTESVRQDAAHAALRPSTLYRPVLSIDGNKWCALYGTDLMNGVAGFGDSPADAYEAFDRAWSARLPEKRA